MSYDVCLWRQWSTHRLTIQMYSGTDDTKRIRARILSYWRTVNQYICLLFDKLSHNPNLVVLWISFVICGSCFVFRPHQMGNGVKESRAKTTTIRSLKWIRWNPFTSDLIFMHKSYLMTTWLLKPTCTFKDFFSLAKRVWTTKDRFPFESIFVTLFKCLSFARRDKTWNVWKKFGVWDAELVFSCWWSTATPLIEL